MIMQRIFALIAGLCFALTGYAQTETITYLHTDHLGSPVVARDAQGNTLWTDTYDPWGVRLNAPTANDADVGYTGHFEEADIGLTYAQARWYDPEIGRFLSPDSIGFMDGGVGHFVRYTYVSNNPIKLLDPDGNAEISASRNGFYLSLTTPDEKVESYLYKKLKLKLPKSVKRLGQGWSVGTEAGERLRQGQASEPLVGALPEDVLKVDEILSQFIDDNMDLASGMPYSREDLLKAYAAARDSDSGFAALFSKTHGSITGMMERAEQSYRNSYAEQNERGIKKFMGLEKDSND